MFLENIYANILVAMRQKSFGNIEVQNLFVLTKFMPIFVLWKGFVEAEPGDDAHTIVYWAFATCTARNITSWQSKIWGKRVNPFAKKCDKCTKFCACVHINMCILKIDGGDLCLRDTVFGLLPQCILLLLRNRSYIFLTI